MKFFSKIKILGFVVTAWSLSWGLINSSEAAVANVSVVNFRFVPATTNINPNDSVLWTWPSGSTDHNVTSTSTSPAWPASATLSGPATFSNTFTTSGTYPYICTIHGFTGAIVVLTNLTPVVTISSPAAGAVFAAPANVTVQANAQETNGAIASVQFQVDSSVLTNETAGPFAATTSALAAGSHSLTAIATDGAGAKATNSVSISVIAPSPLALGAVARSGTEFHFTYSANAGLSYVVQRSTNLTLGNWQTMATNTAGGSSINFTDVNASAGPGFYRVSRLPNP